MSPLATSTVSEVQDFIEDLRAILDEALKAGGDTQRVAAVYDVHLQATKAITRADLVVSVTTEGERVMVKKTDPNQTHPYSTTELMRRVNSKRTGRELTSHDHKALCWKEDLRDNQRMAWKHSNGSTHVWSGEAVSYLAGLEDAYYEQVRVEYREYQRAKTGSPAVD